MNHDMRRQSQSEIAPVQTADVLKHLGNSLNTQWRRYRKRLKHCRERFSEAAVHDVRVEARRLLSTIELLGAFIPERDIKKVRRALKRHLDTFDRLRDTQVQLGYVGRMAGTFPDAHAFYDWLQNRKARFTRTTRKAVKHIKTKRLGQGLVAFEKDIRLQRKRIPRERAFVIVQRAINQTFPGSRNFAGTCGRTTPRPSTARGLRSSASATWSRRWRPCCPPSQRTIAAPCAVTSA